MCDRNETLDKIEKYLYRYEGSRHVARLSGPFDKDKDGLGRGWSCYISGKFISFFATVYAANEYEFILEIHVPCISFSDDSRRVAALYIQDSYKIKESFKGAIHINDSEYVFKTEIAIGNETISMEYFDYCFKALLVEVQACYKRLLEIACDCPDKFEGKMNVKRDEFDSMFEKIKTDNHKIAKSFIAEIDETSSNLDKSDEKDCDSIVEPKYEMPVVLHENNE